MPRRPYEMMLDAIHAEANIALRDGAPIAHVNEVVAQALREALPQLTGPGRRPTQDADTVISLAGKFGQPYTPSEFELYAA